MMPEQPSELSNSQVADLYRSMQLESITVHEHTIPIPSSGGKPPPPPVDIPRGDRDDSPMEKRIEALEAANLETRDRLARIETKLDTFATKADLHEVISGQTWKIVMWMTSVGIVLAGATFTIAKLVH